MKKREKILAGIVGGILGIFILGFLIKGFFLKPLNEVDKQTGFLREKLAKAHNERTEYFNAEDALKKIARRTFSDDLNQASARAGEMLMRQIALAGLNESDFTRLPVGPRRLRGASEIGWSITGKGDLNRIINLLFLVESSPCLHRVESVSLSSYDKPGEIRVRFLFLTLVLDPAPVTDPVELKPEFGLDSPERLAYNTILQRNFLLPYVPAPPPAPEPKKSNDKPTPAPSGPESWRVVSLSEWEGVPEVHLRDPGSEKTRSYKPGDSIKEFGQIVAVDYRPMPFPKNPQLLSHSRVILKIGDQFWAVERGQTLAEKHKLEDEQWPIQ